MLKIENLSVTLNNKNILKNIHLSVKPGEIAMLLGSSGVGKSTLLRVLNHLEPITSGIIKINNKIIDFKKISPNNIIGMVFQQFNLFPHLTVRENITIILEKIYKINKSISTNTANDLLKHYKLEDLSSSYPSQLSGGQKQRLAIARALALKPQIICFDEPTSALDPLLTTYVAQNIQELAKQNYIILIATHDTLLIEKLNCTIHLMQDGAIIQSVDSNIFWNNKSSYPQINSFISGTNSQI
ncbi:ATP-binding cassette domain-containing protein [Candidatus Dependentiae bacterium]|nr:ATP-binding cassette domain-containing protein [Candidatus Dependentiae bacterium]MBU4387353.1 ATP-binding cassette domain-containing protein [Candidatus Dependentiae bacterium]MCG2756182.1 ATP-binding cassette domain-containing protein [Candidatus Dependentiae bacterium]